MASTKIASLKAVYVNFKDDIQELLEVTDFSIISWLVLGMSLQLVSQAWLPPNFSYWLPLACIAYKLARSVYDCTGIFKRSFATVKPGVWTTSQVEGSELTSTNDGVVMFVLAGRISHPFGKLSPGTPEIDSVFKDMWKEVEANREKWSYLGRTRTLFDIADEGITVLWLSYWKDLEGLQNFANSAIHRLGQTAYGNNKFPYVGVMHETYHAPKGHWETVYLNMPPTAMGTIRPLSSKGSSDLGLMDALRACEKGSTMYSRMGRMKAKTDEKDQDSEKDGDEKDRQ